MAKYRICSGLAMAPEHDMKLLKEMSRKGWHLTSLKGIFYRFEEGETAEYEYALNMEMKTDQDMLAYYEASGWKPVVIGPGYQIFRAKKGTVPIFSDQDSAADVLERNQKKIGKWAGFFSVLIAIWLFVTNTIDLGPAGVIVMMILMICFVFTLFPYVGYSRSLRKLQKNR
ncbi:MAG TPA: DUF2812 domain-containing protein [Proteiniclasticum sp.]|nr:DUF2812 domain-containing protein [Proteiniclasticum sp.]